MSFFIRGGKVLKYIAHFRKSDLEIQTVESHLKEVQKLAEQFGKVLDISHVTGLAGILHDVGKYSEEFQQYILEALQFPDEPPKRGSVDHSTAGGKFIYDLLHNPNDIYNSCLAEVVGNVVISHHAYLHDYLNEGLKSNYLTRVQEKEVSDYEQIKEMFFEKVMGKEVFIEYVEEAKEELKRFLKVEQSIDIHRKLMLLTKFVFSSLLDADRTNAREFEENKYEKNDTNTELFKKYYSKLMDKVSSFTLSPKAHRPINKLRANMSDQCEEFARKPSGIYTLSIPTGGGKTLASLRYSLKHALEYKKERIIYIVPYTTIIEQNADEVRNILGKEETILEHHSNVITETFEGGKDSEDQLDFKKKLKLAKDNWDAPIIFTTMVQFLNTFYAHGSRNIRRLHNLSEAVLIFDEVQKVPTNCVSLFNHAVNFLSTYAHSSIVLCTATQPALDFVNHKLDIQPEAEIIKDMDDVVTQFKRVEIIDRASNEQFNQEKLVQFVIDRSEEVKNVLVILNTKKVVKDMYESLKSAHFDIPIYHLSTSMCPEHRKVILDEVKELIQKEKPVICVSTQLIEAGVDISFECVVRSLSGLDSIAQAAGRCNRHGDDPLRYVYVVDYVDENLKDLTEIEKGKNISKLMLIDIKNDEGNHGGSILSVQAMDYYFRAFYTKNEIDLDYPIKGMNQTMIELLTAHGRENGLSLAYKSKTKSSLPLVIHNSYRTAARKFKVIDSPTTAVIVPYGKGMEVIADLNGATTIGELSNLFQRAQRYTVNVYSYQLDLLNESGSLTTLFDDQVYALKEGAYDKEYGLNLEGDSRQDAIMF